MIILSVLCGFDADLMRKLPPIGRYELVFANTWVVIGILVCGFSAGYLFYFSTESLPISFLACLVVLALLFFLERMLISGTGISCFSTPSEIRHWAPSRWRIAIFVLLSLIFSQPLMLFLVPSIVIQDRFWSYRMEMLYPFEQAMLHSEKRTELERQISFYQRLINGTPFPPRKALLIGNQRYASSTLSSPRKDVEAIGKALKKMGFSVTTITDGTKAGMYLGIRNYLKSLKPGDISFFYYGGHGLRYQDMNHMVATDFSRDKPAEGIVPISLLMEGTARLAPSASVIVIDAFRAFPDWLGGGFSSVEVLANTYVAYAAMPGQAAQDGPRGGNSAFVRALLANIGRPVDLDTMFREVRKAVASQTGGRQEVWTSNNLDGSLVLASYSIQPATNTNPEDLQSAISVSMDTHVLHCDSRYPDRKKTGFRYCIAGKVLSLQDDMLALSEQEKKRLDAEMEQTERYRVAPDLPKAEVIRYFFRYPSHVAISMSGTFLITLILSGGIILRGIAFKQAMIDYEKLAHEQHSSYVEGLSTVRQPAVAGKANFAATPVGPVHVLTTNEARDDLIGFWRRQPVTGQT